MHSWVQNADLQPTSDAAPDHIAVDGTVIQVNNERRWLYATVDPETNEFLHIRLFLTRKTQLAVLFLRELQQIVPINPRGDFWLITFTTSRRRCRGSGSDFR